MTCTGWPFASRSEATRDTRSARHRSTGRTLTGALLLATLACADKFTLPPVPEAEIPQPGAYNFDLVWSDMGDVQAVTFAGNLLVTLTRRAGEPRVEVWAPGREPTAPPLAIAGRPIEGLRRPVAISRFTASAQKVAYVADNRGPDLLSSEIACPVSGDDTCAFTLEAEPGGSDRAILARPFEPVVTDFVFTARVRLAQLPTGAVAWLVLGTAPGRIGVWLEIDADALIRPVRSDGAFPIPELSFAFDTWHDVEVDYHDDDGEYDVRIDGALLDGEIPVYHRVNAPVEVLGVRISGEPATLALDDVFVSPSPDSMALALDFESPEDGDGWIDGPYFTNDPPPAVLRYLIGTEETMLQQTLSDPNWLAVHGMTVAEDDRTLYVSVQERDPSDPTGVLRRGQIHRFSSSGERLPAIAETGTGLGFVTTPEGLAFDGVNLIVADEALNRVQKLDREMPSTGVFQIPPLGLGEQWFSGPTGVATDDAGYIYVADTRNDRVLRFAPDGAFADTVYAPGYGPTLGAGEIVSPRSIAATDSTVWIADPAGQRLVKLRRVNEIAGGS